jgi:ABC-type transport system substrate-binding protein
MKDEGGRMNPESRPVWRRCILHPSSFILFLLLLAGCDNNPNPRPLQKTRSDNTPWVVFNWALTSDPDSLDPQHSYDQQSRRVLEPLYDTLLEYHPLKTDPYEVVPCMLAEMPLREKAADGRLSYLCKLKPGILFHDDECFPGGKGREVVAEDVHYVFQRICDPKVESPFFGPISDAVVGMTEAHAAAKANGDKLDYSRHKVSGIEVLDRYSFRIVLSRPYPQLKYWMAFQCLAPVAREAVEYYDGQIHDGKRRGDFHKFQVVGTGPFRMQEYIARQRVRLVRVPGYKTTTFPTDGFPPENAEFLAQFAGKPVPLIDEVNLSIITEPLPAFILTRQGYLDRMAANKDAFASLLTPERTLSPRFRERGMFLEKDAEPSTFWVAFNLDDPVVGRNKKLRQALSCAYDRQTYSDIFLSGIAPVATQILPPGTFGYEKNRPIKYGFDIERGKQLLAEAGYPNGRDASGKQLELTLTAVTDGGESRQRAEFDQKSFEKLGIKVRVDEGDFPTLLSKKDKGQYQMNTSSGWGADYPDPENFFFLLYSKNIPPAGKNEVRYRNPEFDALFEKMAIMDDTPERLEIVKKLSDIVDEDVPMIFTINKQYYTVIQPWARRTHQNQMMEGGVKYLAIDAAMRERVIGSWNRKPLWLLVLAGAVLVAAAAHALRWNRRRDA